MVEISVVICSYNREAYIINAIDSLYQQTLSKDKFEVIVVDNNSIDNTAELVQEYIIDHKDFSLYYLLEARQGASFARNTGAKISKGRLLCFMDDDAIAAKGYLQTILSFFEAYKDVTGLGGRIIPRYIPAKPKWMSYHVSSLVGNFYYGKHIKEFGKGKYPLESNMVVIKSAFDLVGRFNTDLLGVKGELRISGESKDLCLRLQKLGKKIYYHPDAVVEHVVEVKKLTPNYLYRVASGIGRGERIRTKAISSMAFYGKFIEYLYKLAGSVILGIGYVLKGNPAQFLPVVQFRIDAIKGLLGE